MLRVYPWLRPNGGSIQRRRFRPPQIRQHWNGTLQAWIRSPSAEAQDAPVPEVQRKGDHPRRSSGGQFKDPSQGRFLLQGL